MLTTVLVPVTHYLGTRFAVVKGKGKRAFVEMFKGKVSEATCHGLITDYQDGVPPLNEYLPATYDGKHGKRMVSYVIFETDLS